MPHRPCLDCGTITPHTRCPPCQRANDNKRYARRGTTTQRGYGGEWQDLVADAIQLHPWCTDCGIGQADADTTNNPLTGDHLHWPARTIDDIEVCCRSCNSKRGPARGRGAPPRRKRTDPR